MSRDDGRPGAVIRRSRTAHTGDGVTGGAVMAVPPDAAAGCSPALLAMEGALDRDSSGVEAPLPYGLSDEDAEEDDATLDDDDDASVSKSSSMSFFAAAAAVGGDGGGVG